MKFRRLLLALFALAGSAAAQFTVVTGTVTDPNGIAYANGTIVATLVTSASPTLSGLPYSPPSGPTQLDGSGKFTIRLGDNSVLSPGGTQWTFLICSASGTIQLAGGKGPVCFTVPALTISGSSQSITSNISAVALALSNISSGTGTVTSVTFTGDGVVDSSTPSSPPVTTSGTVAATILTQSANTVLAGPTSGGATAPTFRALVAADLPVVTIFLHGNCSGAVGNGTNLVAVDALGGAVSSGSCSAAGSSAGHGTIITHNCILKNLFVASASNGGGAGDGAFTVQDGLSATALTCTTNATSKCNDTTHTVSVLQGDQIWIRAVTSSTSLAEIAVSMECQ